MNSAPGSYLDQQEVNKKIEDVETADQQQQSDWTQSDNTKKDFIKHKPTIPTVAGGTGDVVIAGTGTLTFANGLFTGFVAE